MRLKITKQLSGSIDGLHLDRFAVGGVYDVGTSLANYLLAMGAAEPMGDEPATRGLGMEHHEILNELRRRLSGGDPPAQSNASDGKPWPGKRR